MTDDIELSDAVLQELVHAEEDLGRLQRAVALLPPEWADTWLMRLQGKTQAEIAIVMGWTQVNTHYVLGRAQRALTLLMALPDIDERSIEDDLSPYLEPHLVRVLQAHYRTCNLTRTAQKLGYTGSPSNINTWAKGRILKALRALAAVPEGARYVEFFTAALSHPWAWGRNERGNWTTAERREIEAAEAKRIFKESSL